MTTGIDITSLARGPSEFDPKTAWKPDEVGLPLHPGAERVYREKGWME